MWYIKLDVHQFLKPVVCCIVMPTYMQCMYLNTEQQTKEVGYLSVLPVKLRQSRMKAMSTSEPAASQGILTVVSVTV